MNIPSTTANVPGRVQSKTPKIAGVITTLLHTVLKLTWPLSDIITSFFYRLIMGPQVQLPPIRNSLLLCSATDLAEKIRTRKVKCENVVKAYVERCREINPFINAVIDERYEDALNDAKAVDRFLESGKKSVEEIARDTPLLGVPFTCKEEVGVKGMLQTCGGIETKNRVAEIEPEVTTQYKKAGAIPLTVTNVSEGCIYWDTMNTVFGRTKNPYDHTRSVGGSSGGEAALISSGGALIGLSDDLGGSIRLPTSFCCLYGHKPTKGIVSNQNIYPINPEEDAKIEPYLSTGPMCRYANDLPLLMHVLAADKKIQFNKKVNFSNMKIYYMEEIPGLLTSAIPEIKEKIRLAAKYFEVHFGSELIQLKMEELKYSLPIYQYKLLERNVLPVRTIFCDENGTANMRLELFKSLFRRSSHTFPTIFYAMHEIRSKGESYYKCLQLYQKIEEKFQAIFHEDAILLIPTHPEPPPHYLMTVPKILNTSYIVLFGLLGFPTTEIPAGMYKDLPIGIQAVSGHYKDHITLAVAQELDKIFGGWINPSSVDVNE